ncbi:MAG: carboxypeptidase regulatory-like domain-containing protein [Deltaproteobacteria bacterium]|nr:carboxypeptidase regulatory-like domain-containing protein [Deltaproteobacteria bacterium]
MLPPRGRKISSASAIIVFAALVSLAAAVTAIMIGREDVVGTNQDPDAHPKAKADRETGAAGRADSLDGDRDRRPSDRPLGFDVSCRVAGTLDNGTAARVRVHLFEAELGVEARLLLGGHAFSVELPAFGAFVATAMADDGRTVEATGACRGPGQVSLQLQFPDGDANATLVSGQCVYLETGAAVADAMVRAVQASASALGDPFQLGSGFETSGGRDRVLWSTVTNTEGHFQVRVKPGAYAVRCLKEMDEGVPASLFVSARPALPLTLFVEARASVAGEVRNEDGRTVAGVEVMGRPARLAAAGAEAAAEAVGRGGPGAAPSGFRTARTDETGRFLLRGLPVGPVVVEAHTEDAFAEAQGLARAALPYTEFELVLRREGPSIRGVVQSTDASVPLVAAAVLVSVEAMPPARGRAPRVPVRRSTTVGDEGRFFLGGLAPGKYAVRAKAPGWAETRVEVEVGQSPVEVTLALDRACDAELVVEPADPRLPVVVTVRRAESALRGPHASQPNVSKSSDGTPERPLERELSGQTGDVLRLADVVGTASLLARTVGSVARRASATSVDLCRGEPIRLVLGTSGSSTDGEDPDAPDAEDNKEDPANGQVVATVLNDEKGPVAGVRVSIHPGEHVSQTDEQGRARFEDVVPGRYRAFAEGSNETKGFSLAAGAHVDIAFTVQSDPGEIRGTVTAMGIPVEGAKVLAVCAPNGAMPDLENARVETRTDSAGGFRFSPSGGGFCTVRAEHATKGRSEPVTLKAGALPAWIELEAMASIEGRILVRGTERPAVPASLTITTRGRASSLEVRTAYVDDPSGAFRVDGLSPGTISVAATTELGQGHLDVSVVGGEVRRGVDLFVFASGVVSGRVVQVIDTPGGGAPTLRPIGKARVSVVGFDGGDVLDSTRLGRVATGQDGRFRLTVPAGRLLRVYASSSGFYPQGSEPFDLGASDGPTDVGDIALTARGGPAEKEGGVGIMIAQDPRGARVIQFTEVSPGRDAGLQVGDVIVSVDGEAVSRQPIINWVVSLRGPVGTKVVLGVERGAGPTSTFVVVRGNVGLKEVPALLE